MCDEMNGGKEELVVAAALAEEKGDALSAEELTKLARVFCQGFGKARAEEIELGGFGLADLTARGLIQREAGRFSVGYLPRGAVVARMWELEPALCSLLWGAACSRGPAR